MRRVVTALVALAIAGCGAASAGWRAAQAGGQVGARSDAQAHLARVDAALDAVAPAALPGNRLELLVDGHEGFPALEKAIAAARRSIWFETFIWHNDATGQRLAKLLAARKDEGLDVRVVVDPMGTGDKNRDRDVLRVMLDHQVPVRLYRPRVFGSLNNITHRKLYLFDGERGFTGGMNLGEHYEHDWHDLLVDVRGPAARDMHRVFAEDWNVSGAADLKEDLGAGAVAAQGTTPVRTLETDLNDPHGGQDLYAGELAALASARRSIRMEQVFLSDDAIIEHLERAAKRGVDVRVIVNEKVNLGIFRQLNRYFGKRMTKAGVKLRFYEQRYSHVKFVSIDGAWIMLGSANADTRSYQLNQELSLGISDPAFVADADRRVFDRDWGLSREPAASELNVSPLQKPLVLLADLLSYYL